MRTPTPMLDIVTYPLGHQWAAQIDQVTGEAPDGIIDLFALAPSQEQAVTDLLEKVGVSVEYEIKKLESNEQVKLLARKPEGLNRTGDYLKVIGDGFVEFTRRGDAKRMSIHEAYQMRRNYHQYRFKFEKA